MSQHTGVISLSFSGLDGAGKTTQISLLRDRLSSTGLQVLLISFWEDIAVLKPLRESASYHFFKGEKGVGTPSKPINRQDKNVKAWYLKLVRLFIYLLDAFHLQHLVRRVQDAGIIDIVIFDRYIYDELANLYPHGWLISAYIRWLLKFVPQPNVAFLLDVDPASARERKPEYPIPFLRMNRTAYAALSELAGMTIIRPMNTAKTQEVIADHVFQVFAQERDVCTKSEFPRHGCGGI